MAKGSKGTTDTTTNQTQTYTPAGLSYIQNALNQGQAAAQLPFNIPQAPVAGFSPDQLSGFGAVQQAQGSAQPYYNQAQSFFSPQGASQFFNPMSDAIMAQMQNVFGQQNQQNNANLVQSAGGVGADRIAVGQGNLANQQGLAAGQTLAQLYQQAQNTAQSAGQNMAGLGSNVFNTNMQGAQGLLGIGGMQQGLAQQQMNAPYQQALAAAAFPYQQAQFDAGITGALAPAMGGTTQGTGTTTTQYNPSLASQIGGGALAAGSLFLARGGGVPDEPIDISAGYIPKSGNISASKGAEAKLNLNPSTQMTPPKAIDFGAIGKMAGKLGSDFDPASWGGGSMLGGDAFGGTSRNPLPGLTAADYGAGYDGGGAVSPFAQILGNGGSMGGGMNALPMLWGGQNSQKGSMLSQLFGGQHSQAAPSQAPGVPMGSSPYQTANPYAYLNGLADGGAIDDDPSPATFDERFPYRMPDAKAVKAWEDDAPIDAVAYAPESKMRSAAPSSPRSMAMAPTDDGAQQAAAAGPTPPTSAAASNGKGSGIGDYVRSYMHDPAKMAMLAAGLNTMRTGSLAEGVGSGTKYLQQQETVDQASRKLDQEAQAHLDEMSKMTPYQEAQIGIAKAKLDADKTDVGVINDDTAKFYAQIFNKTGSMPQLGYGKIAAANRTKIAQFAMQDATGKNISPDEIAANRVDYAANRAGATTAARQQAGIDRAVIEAQNTFPLAEQASAAVPRGKWVPLNRAELAIKSGTSDPALAQFVVANQGAVNAYAAAMGRGSPVTTVHAQQHAEELLRTASSHEAYAAALHQMQKEMEAARKAPVQVQQDIRNRVTGQQPQGGGSSNLPATPAVVRQGVVNSGPNAGKRVIEYSDGTRAYQ